jgi:probable HAF family extracellular repeat protein
MRRYFTVFAVVVCLGFCCGHLAPLVAGEPPVYEIDDLGSLGGNFTLPSDVNDAGDVVGTAQTATFEYHAFLYTDGSAIRDLGTLKGTGQSQAFGINNHRHVSGYFTRSDASIGAFLYGDDIGTIDLGSLPGAANNSAGGLNDADQVTGSSFLPSGGHAFLWSVATGMQDLGTLGGTTSNGARVNVHGQAVGTSIVLDDPYFPVSHAFRYTAGAGIKDLGTPTGTTNRTSSFAAGINVDGDVVGYSNDPAYESNRAFLYTDRDGLHDLGTLGGSQSQASDVNDNGAIVGVSSLPSGQQRAFFFTDVAGMVDLNSLIDSTTGWTLFTAAAINNYGTIVGTGTIGGRSRGYRARRIRDDSAPEIEALVTPVPNALGWNNSDVTVRWSVRDPESGIAGLSGCETQTLTNNTSGITLSCSATNPFGGSSSRSVTIKIDKTPPEIGAVVSPQPNPAGWNNSNVTVVWNVRDPESGIVSSSGCETRTFTNETAGVTLTCNATNAAAGSSSRSIIVMIDKTPPVLTCAATPSVVWPPNGDMVAISIAVTARDALSGVSGFTLQSISVDDPAAGPQAITGFTVGAASTTGFVQALRQGDGTGRTYAFTYMAVDAAGLTGSCTALVMVPHDMSH